MKRKNYPNYFFTRVKAIKSATRMTMPGSLQGLKMLKLLTLFFLLFLTTLTTSASDQHVIAGWNYGNGKVMYCGMSYMMASNNTYWGDFFQHNAEKKLFVNMVKQTSYVTNPVVGIFTTLASAGYSNHITADTLIAVLARAGITGVKVTSGMIDTEAEINNYDVIIMGGSGQYTGEQNAGYVAVQSVVKNFAQNNHGGVIFTGWSVFTLLGIGASDYNDMLPVEVSYDYGYQGGYTLLKHLPADPLFDGVGTLAATGYCEFPEGGLKTGAIAYGGLAPYVPYVSPTVTTTAITTFTANTATMGGNVTAEGSAPVTARGVVYSSTDNTPELGESGVSADANGSGTGSFSETIEGLTAGLTYYVRAYATSTAGTGYGSAASFTTTSCVNPTSGGSISENQIICFGNIPTTLSSVLAPSGHTGTLEYKWQLSTTSASAGFSDIELSNSATWSPGELTVTTWFRRMARVECITDDWASAAVSNTVTMTVRPVFSAGAINTTGETICFGNDPTEIPGETTANGGDGTISYQWQSSTVSEATGFADISGADEASYDPPTGLTESTWYRRMAKDVTCSGSAAKQPLKLNHKINSPLVNNNSELPTTIPQNLLSIANGKAGGVSPNHNRTTALRYDDGVNVEGLGLTAGGTFLASAYWPAATMGQYTGMKLSQVEIYIRDMPSSCVIKIYGQGTSGTPGNLLHEQSVTVAPTSWNLISLSSEVEITGEDLWIGYEITNDAGMWPAGIDDGPAVEGFGDILKIGEAWYTLSGISWDNNWNIAATLNGGGEYTNSAGVWKVEVLDDFTPGAIETTGETICYNGDPAEIGSATPASGGDQLISYQWQSSATGESTDFTDISGAEDATYTPDAGLTESTWYRRTAKDGTCNTSFSTSEGLWKVSVHPEFTPGSIETTGETICFGNDPSEIPNETAASGGYGTISYHWQSSTVSEATGFADISGAEDATYTPDAGLTESTWYRRTAKDATCNTSFIASTGVWKVSVHPEFTPGAIETTGEIICYNSDPSEIPNETAANGGDGNISYQWQSSTVSEATGFANISGAEEASYTPPTGLTETTWYRRTAKDGTCTGNAAKQPLKLNHKINSPLVNNNSELPTAIPQNLFSIANDKAGGVSPNHNRNLALRYDDGVNYQSLGLGEGGTFLASAYWPAATMGLYTGMKLSQVEIYIKDLPSSCVIKIYGQGTSGTPGNLLHEQSVTVTPSSWNLISLSNEVEITGEDLWIGYEITQVSMINTAGLDDGPAVSGFGDKLLFGGSWFNLSNVGLNCNWNIAATLNGGGEYTNSAGVWKVEVLDDFTPGAIETTGETICYNGDPAEIGSETPASGGDQEISYQWQSSATGEATDFTDISGAEDASYNPPSGITGTTWFLRTAKDETCQTSFSASAGLWKITVEPTPVAGLLTKTPDLSAVCENDNVSAILTAGNGGNGIDELEFRTSNGTWSAWAAYTSGTNISTADLSGVEIRTRRMASTCTSSAYTTVSWSVEATPIAGTLAKTPNVVNVCENDMVSAILASGNGGNGIDELEFRTNNGTWSAWANYTSGTNISTADLSGVEIRTRRMATYCENSTYTTVSWSVEATPIAGLLTKTPDVMNICENDMVSASLTSGNGGNGIDELEFRTNDGAWSLWAAYTSGTNILTADLSGVEIRTRRMATYCENSAYTAVSWSVEATPIAGLLTKTPNVVNVCENDIVSAILTSGNGGNGIDELEFRTNDGAWSLWAAYTSGTDISTADLSGVEIRTRRMATYCENSAYTTVSWSVEATPIAGTLAKTPNLMNVCEDVIVSAILTSGNGGNGIDELEFRTSDGTWAAWAAYTSGTGISANGKTAVEIRTRRLSNTCEPSTYVIATWNVNPLPVPVITGPASICVTSSDIVYSTESSMTGYTWTISAGGTITAGIGTNAITVTWNTAGPQSVSVNYTNENGCTAQSATVYPVTVNPLPVPTISGLNFLCVGTTGEIYTTEPGMTNYTWTVSAGGTITAGALTNAITVSWNNDVAQILSVNYVNENGCTAPVATFYDVTVASLPVPTITGPDFICAGETNVSYTTQSLMSGYNWSVSDGGIITSGNGTNQITVTWNNEGPQTVSVNYTNTNGCTANSPSVMEVTVRPLPTYSFDISATEVCSGETVDFINYFTGVAPWTVVYSYNGVQSSFTTSDNPDYYSEVFTETTENRIISVTDGNGCTAIIDQLTVITVNPLPIPTIAGSTSVCLGANGKIYTTEAGMSGYNWAVSEGGTITSGAGTNAITVDWNGTTIQTVSVNYTNENSCTAANASVIEVTITPLPLPTITGSASVCAGSYGVSYTTEAQMSDYNWSISAGGNIISGNGTHEIAVNWNDAGDHTVSVSYTNANGCTSVIPGSMEVEVRALPAEASSITGTSTVCAGTRGVVYSIPAIANASICFWTLPEGAAIVSGFGTNSITVDFDATAVSGMITARGANTCGQGIASPAFSVTVNPIPQTPVITQNNELLTSSAPEGNQWFFNGIEIPGANGQQHEAMYTGEYSVMVTLEGCSSEMSDIIMVIITGNDGNLSVQKVELYPNPNHGQFILSISTDTQKKIDLRIFTNLGVVIYEKAGLNVQGTLNEEINLSGVAPGVYYVRLTANDQQIIRKVVID